MYNFIYLLYSKVIRKIGSKTTLISDEKYIKAYYFCIFKRKIDLQNPSTFNEKLQWLKLYDRKPIYTEMVDKDKAKAFIADKIGWEYVIPTLGVYKDFESIDFDKLPEKFVMKCTHDSGCVIVCKNKSSFDKEDAKKKLEKALKRNFYLSGREWPYKNVPPRIIIEKYIEDIELGQLVDYKLYTFNSVPRLMMIIKDREKHETKAAYYDMNYQELDFSWGYPCIKESITKPKNFELMKKFSRILAENTSHLRVDFYEANGRLYVGELTFYDGSGFEKFYPEEWDKKLGDYINLPKNS